VLRRAVLEGGGIGILPTYFLRDDLRQERLVRVLSSLEPERLGIHAIFLSRQYQPLALRLLIDPRAALRRRGAAVGSLNEGRRDWRALWPS
jgi:DNA-binding transcriptional LysR family regulator